MILQHDWTGRYTRTYDVMNRVTGALYPFNKRITFAYDSRGLRDHMIDTEASRTTYVYDAAERYRTITDPEGGIYTFTDDAAGQRVKEELANGTIASMIYDGAGQTTRVANLKSDASVISQFDYRYDDAGNRIAVTEDTGDRVTWTYDETSQLTAEHRSGANAYATTFSYDPLGNRLILKDDGALTTSVYDAANQLKHSEDSTGRTTYTYDPDGNQQIVENPSNALTTTVWDYENQSTRVQLPNADIHTSIYNSDQWRVAKVDPGPVVTSFVWDDQNYIAEYDDAAMVQVQYRYEPQQYGNLLSQKQLLLPFYHHYDALGSTRELTNALEVETDSWIYRCFGETQTRTGVTDTPYQWVGGFGYFYDDPVARYLVRFRWYDAHQARWIDHSLKQLRNDFKYASNSPVQHAAPIGTQLLLHGNRHFLLVSDGFKDYETVPIVLVGHATLPKKCPRNRRMDERGGSRLDFCPKKWKSKLGVEQYGCYCGREPKPPRKMIPPPIDEIDRCCCVHDNDYDRVTAKKMTKEKADARLCCCAQNAIDTNKCTNRACTGAYNKIWLYFRCGKLMKKYNCRRLISCLAPGEWRKIAT